MNQQTINQDGMQLIVDQLKEKCKPSVFDGWLDADLIDSRRSQEMLSAWAADLEDVLDSRNGDEVEISQHDTISGHTEHLSVTSDGIDINYDLSLDAERRLEDLEDELQETEWSDPNRTFGRDKTYASVAQQIEDCKQELIDLKKATALLEWRNRLETTKKNAIKN